MSVANVLIITFDNQSTKTERNNRYSFKSAEWNKPINEQPKIRHF